MASGSHDPDFKLELKKLIIAACNRETDPESIGDDEALILIATGQIIEGWISNKALSKVQEWCEFYRTELQQNWMRAMSRQQTLQPIKPLP